MQVTWWIDGRLVGPEAAQVRADDHGLVVGDGVFETVKVTGGQPFALSRHLARLEASAAGLGLAMPIDRARMKAAVAEVVGASGLSQARLRITLTGGPGPLGSGRGTGPATLVLAVEALGPRLATGRVAVVPWPRNERGALAGLKTTSYAENVVALAWARAHDADEAIFANTVGDLCEGTGSNVFVVVGGRCLTPPLGSGCLAGVTRNLVVEAGGAEEADIPMAVFDAAEEAFLTSTTRDVQPISSIDGRPLARVDGPLTRAAAEAFAVVARKPDP